MSHAKIINGRILAEKIKSEVVSEILALNKSKAGCLVRPNLAIILIGEREDSMLYVRLKEEEAKKVGIGTHIYKCPKEISEKKILEIIDYLNKDRLIDAILVQLPLPKNLDTDKIIKSINPAKDVDRFHPDNLKTLMSARDNHCLLPPVHGAVLEILTNINCNLKNKLVRLLINSDIFGKSLAKILERRGAKTKILRINDKNLKKEITQADILITAIGQPKLIKETMIKKDAIIIDVGITKKGKKISGDVDFENVIKKAGYITPVPGGVGPLTIAMLLRNTLALYKNKHLTQ